MHYIYYVYVNIYYVYVCKFVCHIYRSLPRQINKKKKNRTRTYTAAAAIVSKNFAKPIILNQKLFNSITISEC